MKIKTLLVFLFFFFSSLGANAYLTYHAAVTTGDMQFEGRSSESFTESQLGLRYSFSPVFSIQASLLARFVENDENYYGGQVLAPITSSVLPSLLSLQAYLAPGFRVLRGFEAPVMEGGVSTGFRSVRLGVGYRVIFNEALSNGLEDESQVFIFTSFRGF
jgi:hypothetical protein